MEQKEQPRLEMEEMEIINKKQTNLLGFPIRQLQIRFPLPTEEEPPKDRMDPGLQEVRYMDLREGL